MCSKIGIDKGPRIHALQVYVSCSVSFRERGARLRVGRGPGDRHIIRLLSSGEEGVDASDDSFVCH